MPASCARKARNTSCRMATCCTSSSTSDRHRVAPGTCRRYAAPMIRRLLLALLVACLALPAAAAPLHCMQGSTAAKHGGDHHGKGKQHETPPQVPPAHDCI